MEDVEAVHVLQAGLPRPRQRPSRSLQAERGAGRKEGRGARAGTKSLPTDPLSAGRTPASEDASPGASQVQAAANGQANGSL